MIELGTSDQDLDRSLLTAPGAFLWWYVDQTDGQGNGAVCIWSYGLPFLPGLMSGARHGRPTAPAERPAFNLVTYKDGRPDLYLLQELPPEAVAWTGDGAWTFGRSRIRRQTTDGHVVVSMELDLDVPGTAERVVGTWTLTGPAPATGVHERPRATHVWEPVSVGSTHGRLELTHGERTVCIEGRAYADRNAGDRPLDALGIARWRWGRLAMPDHDLVWYVLDPESGEDPSVLLWRADADGRLHALEVHGVALDRWRPSLFGPWYPDRLRLTLDAGELCIQHGRPVDDGPFYLRWLVQGTLGGASGHGVSELILPRRIDLAVHRPLVRMRVQPAAGPGSMWLPLFAGFQGDRWARLLRPARAP